MQKIKNKFGSLTKKGKIAVVVFSMMFLLAGGALAAWILQAQSSGNVLGTKSKHLSLANSVAGSCDTFTQDLVGFWNRPEMTTGQRYDHEICTKSNKNLTTVHVQATEWNYYKFGELIGIAPEVGDSDLADKINVYYGDSNGSATTVSLKTLMTTGIDLAWDASLNGTDTDTYELDVEIDATAEDDPTLNGYSINDLVLIATGTEAP